MTQPVLLILILFSGLVSVTIIDTAGAYASRKLHFKYSFLIIPSLLVYILAGFFACKLSGFRVGLLMNLMIGFYDATAGWKLSQKVKPYTGFSDEQLQMMNMTMNLKVMLIISTIATTIGYAMT